MATQKPNQDNEHQDEFNELSLILERLPEKDRNRMLNQLAAKYWQSAPWANITPRIQDTEEAQGGVGAALYYFDQLRGTPMVVLVEPNRKDGVLKFQIPGGHMNFADHETREDACLREINEEVINGLGPVIQNLNKDTFEPLDEAFIYLQLGPVKKARFVNSYAVYLDDDQVEDVLIHVGSQSVKETLELTNNEIRAVHCVPLQKIIDNPHLLNHQDQYSLFQRLDEKIKREMADDREPTRKRSTALKPR